MRGLGRGRDAFGCALAALLMALALTAPLMAASGEMDDKAARLANFANDLQASLRVQNETLNDTAVRFTVSGKVYNSGQSDWELHLISNRLDGTGWHYERFLGLLQPGSDYEFEQYFEAHYTGVARAKTQYAVVAKGDEVAHGAYFWLNEDWDPYVRRTQAQMTDMALVFVPVAGSIVLLLIIVLAEWGYTSEAPEDDAREKEYTLRTFFIPHLAGRSLWSILANLTAHPLVWLAELAVLGIVAGEIWLGLAGRLAAPETVWLLSLAAAALMPVFYFALAWIYNELYERMPLRFMAGMFMWGVTAACAALLFNTVQSQVLGQWLGADSVLLAVAVTALVAPATEELFKGLGLLVIRGHHEFNDALHGLHLGFAVGVGFAFVENWFYLASRTDPLQIGLNAWIGLAVYRSVFNALAHGSFSAVLGAGLGWAKAQRWGRISVLVFLPGLVMATILHSLFNLTAISDHFQAISAQFPVFGFNPVMTLTLVGMLIVLAAAATAEFRRQRQEKMDRAVRRMRTAGGGE